MSDPPSNSLRNGLLIAAFTVCTMSVALALSGRSIVFGSSNTTVAGPMHGVASKAASLPAVPRVTDETIAEIYATFEQAAKKGDPAAAAFIFELARAQRQQQADRGGEKPAAP